MTTIENVLLALFLSLLIAVAIVGNTLVCIAIVTDASLRKLSNLFFFSLAVADLLVASVVMPFALVNDLSDTGWVFGQDFCKLWISADVMACTASIINMLAISFDRYVHIKDPLQYTEWITRRTVPLAIAATWIISALISFLPISLDLHVATTTTNSSSSSVDAFNGMVGVREFDQMAYDKYKISVKVKPAYISCCGHWINGFDIRTKN